MGTYLFIQFFLSHWSIGSRKSRDFSLIPKLKSNLPLLRGERDCVTVKWCYLSSCGTKYKFCPEEDQNAVNYILR